MAESPRGKWLTIAEAVSTTGHDRGTINKAIKRGELHAEKFGNTLLIRSSDFDEWAKTHPTRPRKKQT